MQNLQAIASQVAGDMSSYYGVRQPRIQYMCPCVEGVVRGISLVYRANLFHTVVSPKEMIYVYKAETWTLLGKTGEKDGIP